MRKIAISHSLLTFLDELEYTEAALSADPDSTPLATPFRDAIEDWGTFFKKERAARRDVTRAEALVSVRNERLDFITRGLGRHVRAFSGDLMGKLFGNTTPGEFVRKGLRAQCEKTRDVILPELQRLEEGHPLAPLATKLDTAVNDALSALDTRAKAKGNRQLTANEVEEWKEGINALRMTTYAELLKIATDKRYPKSWVESFYRPAPSARVEPEELSSTPDPEIPEG